MRSRYDERQVLNRLKAYKLGFYMFFAEILVLAIFDNYWDSEHLISDNALLFFGLLIFLPTMAVMLFMILSDSYDPPKGKSSLFGFSLQVLMLSIWLPKLIQDFCENPIDAANHINPNIITICLMSGWAIDCLAYYLHYFITKKYKKKK